MTHRQYTIVVERAQQPSLVHVQPETDGFGPRISGDQWHPDRRIGAGRGGDAAVKPTRASRDSAQDARLPADVAAQLRLLLAQLLVRDAIARALEYAAPIIRRHSRKELQKGARRLRH